MHIDNIVGPKTQIFHGTAGTGKSDTVAKIQEREESIGNVCRIFSFSKRAVKDYGKMGSTIHSQCAKLLGAACVAGSNDETFMNHRALYGMYLDRAGVDRDDVDMMDTTIKRKLDQLEMGVSQGLWGMMRNRYVDRVMRWNGRTMRCEPKYAELRNVFNEYIAERNGIVPTYIDNSSVLGDFIVNELNVEDFVHDVARYEAWKLATDVIDYTDILLRVYMARGKLHPSEAVIIIDEAQDLTELQWRIVKQWARYAEKIMILGDNAQSIYNFQGVKRGGMDLFPSFNKPIALDTIYRYGPNIWNRANEMIQYTYANYDHGKIGLNKNEVVRDRVIDIFSVAELVEFLGSMSPVRYKSFALIAPTNHQAFYIKNILADHGLEGFNCSTMHGIKGDTTTYAIKCCEISDYWVKQVPDASELASMNFVAQTRARSLHINIHGIFSKGYQDIETAVETLGAPKKKQFLNN
jgi:superfamily I DNA/RNA helicase